MSEVKTENPNFFPISSRLSTDNTISGLQGTALKRNSDARKQELESLAKGGDSNVTIDAAVRDFSRIKKSVDASAGRDVGPRLAELKRKIEDGSYQVDYDELADRILNSEF